MKEQVASHEDADRAPASSFYWLSLPVLALATIIEWKIFPWAQIPEVGGFIGQMIGGIVLSGIFACPIILIKHKFQFSKKAFSFNSFTCFAVACGYLFWAIIHLAFPGTRA